MQLRNASPQAAIAGPADGIHRRRWLILGVLITSLMAIVLDNTVLNVALKTIADPEAARLALQSQDIDGYFDVPLIANKLKTKAIAVNGYSQPGRARRQTEQCT